MKRHFNCEPSIIASFLEMIWVNYSEIPIQLNANCWPSVFTLAFQVELKCVRSHDSWFFCEDQQMLFITFATCVLDDSFSFLRERGGGDVKSKLFQKSKHFFPRISFISFLKILHSRRLPFLSLDIQQTHNVLHRRRLFFALFYRLAKTYVWEQFILVFNKEQQTNLRFINYKMICAKRAFI